MDGRTICDAMVAIDEELAVLNRRRQLLSELLHTFQVAPPAAEIEHDRPAPAAPATKKKPAKRPAPAVARKWDQVVAKVAIAKGCSAAELGAYYGVTADMGRYLIRQCRTRGLLDDKSAKVRPTPIAPKTSTAEPKPERFSTDAVASMLGGVA